MKKLLSFVAVLVLCAACASFMEDHKAEKTVKTHLDYERSVVIEKIQEPVPEKKEKKKVFVQKRVKKVVKKLSKNVKAKEKKAEPPKAASVEKKKVPAMRMPKIEDSEGFDGRRPIVDPFSVGEKVIWEVSYLNMSAGEIAMKVLPFVKVNNRKSYHFSVDVKSSSMFAFFYKVKDNAETYLDFETMKPHNLEVHVKESKQIKESRTYFDWNKLEGNYWMKRKKKGRKEETKQRKWKVKDYSQNFVSAMFYLRTFTFSPGKTISFNMADEGKNFIFRAKVLRREKISIDAGEFNTFVVKPEVEVGGSLKPVGDILLWITDDERKFLVKIKTAIKIGSIVAEAKSIKP